MRKLFIVLFSMSLVFCVLPSFAQDNNTVDEKVDSKEAVKVDVYYFHGTRRCETCKAVGNVSKGVVEDKYGDNENVRFIEIDFDQPGNEDLVEKFEVTSSSLYVYNQTDVINLTTYAFQYAKTNPDKLRSKLKSTINKNFK